MCTDKYVINDDPDLDNTLKKAKENCKLCRSTGYTAHREPPHERVCNCMRQIRLRFLLGELYRYPSIYDDRLNLGKSYRLVGDYVEVAARARALVERIQNYNRISSYPMYTVTDRDVRQLNLAAPGEPSIKEVANFDGLVILRLGFAPSKNAQIGNYIAELIGARLHPMVTPGKPKPPPKPLWVVQDGKVPEYYSSCAALQEGPLSFGALPTIKLESEPERSTSAIEEVAV